VWHQVQWQNSSSTGGVHEARAALGACPTMRWVFVNWMRCYHSPVYGAHGPRGGCIQDRCC
jgi:hypothetical protein